MKPGSGWLMTVGATVVLQLFSPYSRANYIFAGDTVNTVVDQLGPPQAIVSTDTREVYYFDRGKVIIQDGLVTSSDLISEQQAEQEKQRRDQRAEYERMKKLADGLNLKQAKLGDRAFQNLSAADQLTFWRTFEKSYPEISVDSEFALALQKLALEQEVIRRVQEYGRRLAELERELAAAKEELREAKPDRLAAAAPIHFIVEAPRHDGPLVVVNPAPEPDLACFGGSPFFVRRGLPAPRRSVVDIHPARIQDHRGDQASSVFRPPLPPAARWPRF